MRIVAVCGAGIGTSAILQANIERALDRLDMRANVASSGVAGVAAIAGNAQLVVTSTELASRVRDELTGSYAEVVEVANFFDVGEIEAVLERSLG